MNAKHPATSMTGTVASPSSPSVRLTAFEEPTIMNTENGIKNQPKFMIKSLKNGKYKFVNSIFWDTCDNPNIPTVAIKICEISFNLNEMPEEFLNLILQRPQKRQVSHTLTSWSRKYQQPYSLVGTLPLR